jgi:hypothetical protein
MWRNAPSGTSVGYDAFNSKRSGLTDYVVNDIKSEISEAMHCIMRDPDSLSTLLTPLKDKSVRDNALS